MQFKASAKQTTQEWRIKKGHFRIFEMAEFSPRATLYPSILLIIMQCIYARRDYAEFNLDHPAPLFTPTTPNLRLRWNDKWKVKTNSGTAEIFWVITENGLKINCSGTRADCIGARHPMALDRLSCKISDSQSYVSLDIFWRACIAQFLWISFHI